MTLTPDGSPIELYTLLPDLGEGELVAEAVVPPASILELGCGTGRMTRQLVARGFRVTGVDESAEMLAHVRDAETVQATIEGLDLGRRFDAVLLASNLLTAESERRRAFLQTCRRHAELAIVEMLPLGWQPSEDDRVIGEVVTRMRVARFDTGVVEGTMEYEARGKQWTQPFTMRVFAGEAELDAALAEGGMTKLTWLDRDRGWFTAVPDRSR